METSSEVVLILGSGTNAPEAGVWPRNWFDRIVVINNAWRVRDDWDELIFPEDFPEDRRPASLNETQRLIEADRFVPAQNALGGFVYGGGTMAFTAGYWALNALRPRIMAFLGCDMIYALEGPTHFYGTGTADPLRADVTLQDLGAKSARLGLLAAAQGCHCVNLSKAPSELLFDRADAADLRACEAAPVEARDLAPALEAEAALGYMVPSGRYWEANERFDPAALARIDSIWRAAWRKGAATARAA